MFFGKGGLVHAVPQAIAVGETELERVASLLSAGEWGEVTGFASAINDTYRYDGNTTSIYEFCNRACWDPQLLQLRLVGGADNAGQPISGHGVYDAATNSWSAADPGETEFPTLQLPSGNFGPVHSYDYNIIDTSRREQWYHHRGSSGTDWWVRDLDGSGWTNLNTFPSLGSDANAMAYFPARDSIILFTSGATDEIREYDLAARTWGSAVTTTLPAGSGGTEGFCIYSPRHLTDQDDKGCVIFGCTQFGNTVDRFCRMAPDGTFTNAPVYPGGNELNCRFSCAIADPVSGHIICFAAANTGDPQVWELNVETLTWTRLTGVEGSGGATGNYFHGAVASCQNFGVILVPKVEGGEQRLYVYKHTDSMTLDEVAADADTLNVLDFQTLGRCAESEMFFAAGQGSGVQVTDTTDPDRYLRDHPNADNFISGGFLAGTQLNMQGGNSHPWESQVHTLDVQPNSGPWIGPRIVSGQGEFEDIIGSANVSCLRLRTPDGQTDKASGDFLIPFARQQEPGDDSTPQLYAVAGRGAEVWIRYALKQDAAFITTDQVGTGGAGTTGPKRHIISGDSTSQELEETITGFADPNHEYIMYSNSGAEQYPTTTRVYVPPWTVIHVRIIVAPNGTDGTVELYLNDETTPIISETSASHTGAQIITGWDLAYNTTTEANPGYWKLWLTNFVTNKDDTDTHADLDCYYDNVVIRRDTRCPPLRSSSP